MTKVNIFLIAGAAFFSGFLASEYHAYIAGPYWFDKPSVLVSAKTEAVKPVVEKVVDDVSPVIPVKKEFSWNQVNELIAGERYLEAIPLLEMYLQENKNSAPAWLALAHIYKKLNRAQAALNAWFNYLKYEVNAQKIDETIREIKAYLIKLSDNPSSFNDDWPWLIAQLDNLLARNANDGELHLMMAVLYNKINDPYQAQYHALMAANDPVAQKRAEDILAKLNGDNISGELLIPLNRYGNQFLVNVTIEGVTTRLLLDTGASISGLSSSFTAQYPGMLKEIKPIRLNTASGTQDSFLFTVNNITLDSIAFNQHILAQLPMDNRQGFDGLLGIDILGRFDFIIDQNNATLHLKPRKK